MALGTGREVTPSDYAMHRYSLTIALAFALSISAVACGSTPRTIPGTRVTDNQANRDIIEVIEKYRLAVERRDAAALFMMASKKYFEDGGTTDGKDDYGHDQLRNVLTGRFQHGKDVRYSLRYMNVNRRCPRGKKGQGNDGCRAYVDVLIDASYTINNAHKRPVRKDKRDQNQLVLQWENDSWKFLSGM